MSHQALTWAVNLRGVSPQAKLLALHVADNYLGADGNTEPATMNVTAMAEWSGVTPQSVFDYLLELPAIRLRADLNDRNCVLVWLPLPERRAGL